MTTAADLVTALEKLQPGQPWTEPMRTAELAIVAERDAAIALVFPAEIGPTPADAISDYVWRTGRLTAANYEDKLADLHLRAMRTHPALAALLRSLEALDDVAEAAARAATASFTETQAEVGAKAAAAARARYILLIARALAAVGGHEHGAAAHALVALEDLAARAGAARARHEQHERDEAERAAAEERAAQEAADRQADELEAERILAEEKRVHGLPQDLASGPWYEHQRPRALLAATVKRRLLSTRADGIRVNRGGGRGLYTPSDVARNLGNATTADLRDILAALDAAEGRVQPS